MKNQIYEFEIDKNQIIFKYYFIFSYKNIYIYDNILNKLSLRQNVTSYENINTQVWFLSSENSSSFYYFFSSPLNVEVFFLTFFGLNQPSNCWLIMIWVLFLRKVVYSV